jgi:hypothetical protein
MEFTFKENKLNLKDIVPPPAPSKAFVPNWYRSIRPTKNILNLKSCAPFLDALTNGYTQTTWADIDIIAGVDSPGIKVDSKVPLIERRDAPSVTTTDDYYSIEFSWIRHWIPSLPEGYSVLLTHPLNRLDLPFTTLSAVIDLDVSLPHPVGKIPLYLKKNFTGTIPSGTPMFQMFPILREKWEVVVKDFDSDLAKKDNEYIRSFDVPPYKPHLWNKKEYN